MAQNITKKSQVITQATDNRDAKYKNAADRTIYRCSESDEYYFHEGCHILEILNQDSDPALSIARARVAPGKTTRFHALKAVTERYLIQQGEGLVSVGELEEHKVSAGDVVVIPPGVKQRIHNAGKEDLVFLALCTPRFTEQCYIDLEN